MSTVATAGSPCARSPLSTLGTNSREDAGPLQRSKVLQLNETVHPGHGSNIRTARACRTSGEMVRACPSKMAAAATLLQSHCRRRRAQREASQERRRVNRRKQIIREIHASELSYHSSLRVLDEHYMQQVMWKGANTVAALPSMDVTMPEGPETLVAASSTTGTPVAASAKRTPIPSSPMGTPGSTRRRAGKRGRRGSVDSNIAGLTAKLTARSACSTSTRVDFPSPEEVHTMFCGGSLMCLIDLSRQLASHLDTVANGDSSACCGAARKVGDIFVQLAPRFLVFSEYCKRTEEAMEMVTKCQAKYPTFGYFMSHLQSVPASPAGLGGDGAGGTLDLLSYLIMPVQRVPRYVMLLTELLNTIPVEDLDSHQMVAKALDVVRESAVQIDSAVGAEQRRIRLQQVMTSLRGAPVTFATDVVHRTLVREERVELIEKDQPPEGTQLNVSLASIGSHFGLGTPKASAGTGALTPSRSVGGTPSRLSLGGTPNRRRSIMRRKSVCIEPDSCCYGNHLALLFSDCLLITKPVQNDLGDERLEWVDCVWLKDAWVEQKPDEQDDPAECGFQIFSSMQPESKRETDSEGQGTAAEDAATASSRDKSHTLIMKDAKSKAEWLLDLEHTVKNAPPPPPVIDSTSLPSNDIESTGTPTMLMSPLPTTPVRALKNALQRGRRASSGRNLRRGLRRKSTTDASADAAAAAASSPAGGDFRVSQDGSLMGDALPESDADAAALRDAMLEQLHALIALDMRKFLLESTCTGTLSDWAAVSDWAHDTGGGAEERRAERGVWLQLFATVQKELAPQFGLDPETISAPVLDSPADPTSSSTSSVLPSDRRTDCSPVLESTNELPVLDFNTSPASVAQGNAETSAGAIGDGGLTLSLPPLASTPLSTRSRTHFALPSGGTRCTASPILTHSMQVEVDDNSKDNATDKQATTGPETDADADVAKLAEPTESCGATPVLQTHKQLEARSDATLNAEASTMPPLPVRSPRATPASPSSNQQQRSTKRKRRRSSFACCAAAASP